VAEYDAETAPETGERDLPYSREPVLRRGEAKAIRERLRCSQRYYEAEFKSNAERCRNLYQGYHWPRKRKTTSHSPVINYSKYIVDTQVSALAHKGGEVILKPESPLGMENEDRSRRAANWGYRKSEARRETKRALKDCRVYGYGIVSINWDFETKTAPAYEGRPPVEGEPPDAEDVLSAIESGKPLPQPVPGPEITKDYPCVRRLDPRQFRISPEADWVLDNAPYCGYVEIRPLDEVKADPRFREGVTKKLKGSPKSLKSLLSTEDQTKEDDALPSDVKRVELHHYFEKRRQIHVVFADEEPTPVLVEAWYWKSGRYPFRALFDPSLEDDFYMSIPPLMQWEHMQREINESRGQLATHRRRYNRMYIGRGSAISAKFEKDLAAGEDATLLKTEHQDLNQVVRAMETAPLQAEVYESYQGATQDMMTLSGTNAYESGRPPTKRTTKTETEAILGAGGALKQEMGQRYEEFCAGVAEDVFDLMQQYSLRTMQLPIYSEQDQLEGFEPVSKEEIQGDYQFEIAVGSTEIKDKAARFDELGYMAQALLPFFQMGVADPKPFVEQLLNQIPELKDIHSIMQPPPMLPGMGMPPPGGEAGPAGPPGAGPPGPPLPGLQPPNGAPAPGGAMPPELQALLAGLGGQ
jgi:hypothetical protein